MKRKDAEVAARELVDMIAAMRRQMAMQDGTIQRQAARIDVLRAAGDDLAHLLAIDHPDQCVPPADRSLPNWCSWCAALDAWREVDR